MRPMEQQLAVDGGLREAGIEFVEVIVASGEIISKEIGEGDDASRGVFCK